MIHTLALVSALALWSWDLPPGFPEPAVPPENAMSREKVELGRRLFFDPRLSGNGTQACAGCHRPERAFTDGRARALGSTGELHPKSSMSLANVAYEPSLTWSETGPRSLEEQALVPMTNEHPVEMGVKGHEAEVVARLSGDPELRALFAAAFPKEPVSLKGAAKAIASFERTLLSGRAPYDRLVWHDDPDALSPAARRGMALFFGERLHCGSCHGGFTFAGPAVWDGSPPAGPAAANNGVGEERVRIPTLRNIAVTAPYMHDGRFATLEMVVSHYASGGTPNPARSRLVAGFPISAEETCDLVAFLESLTDAAFLDARR